jgi:hypothetical protein
MTGNVVITEVNVLMYVVLSRAEKHVIYEELVGTTKAQRYSRGVAKSKVVVTEFDCISFFSGKYRKRLSLQCCGRMAKGKEAGVWQTLL